MEVISILPLDVEHITTDCDEKHTAKIDATQSLIVKICRCPFLRKYVSSLVTYLSLLLGQMKMHDNVVLGKSKFPPSKSSMDDNISLLQGIPFQSHDLYVSFSKQVKWSLSCTIMAYTYFDKSKWKHGGDTSMAQNAYKLRTPGLILGFRGFK